MADKPEEKARQVIDGLLAAAGWTVQSREEVKVSARRGIAIREFPLKSAYGFVDYLLYVDGVPAGVVEAKKEGETLTGYEIQTEKYSVGLPPELDPARSCPSNAVLGGERWNKGARNPRARSWN